MDFNNQIGFDPDVLYHSSTEYQKFFSNSINDFARWIALGKNIEVLQEQLDQAKRDVELLEEMKENALNDPETFVERLKSGDLHFPKMQSIPRIPDLELSKYNKRTSRRGNTKYEQNLEFLLAKVNELHRKSAAVPPVLLSSSIPVTSSMLNSPSASIVSQVREKFYEISGVPPLRPVSAPAPSYASGQDTPVSSGRATPVYADQVVERERSDSANTSSHSMQIDQPQPRAQRFPRLNENEHVNTHYNLPWSEEEMKRLEELLVVFPEEAVSARRYAKIAQALGTRTASQVTNRIHKIIAKKARLVKRESEANLDQARKLARTLRRTGIGLSGSEMEDLDLEDVDEETKASPEYQEFLQLKQQMHDIKAQVTEHAGFKCDSCAVEPIVGIRYHCEVCPEDFDLCQACMNLQLENKVSTHDPSHTFTKVTTAVSKPAQVQ